MKRQTKDIKIKAISKLMLLSMLMLLVRVMPLGAVELSGIGETILIDDKEYVALRSVASIILQQNDSERAKETGINVEKDGTVVILKGAEESLEHIITRESISYIDIDFLREYYDMAIEGNKAPEITGITGLKKSYGIGEAVELGYTYTNEEDEGIGRERWSYANVQSLEDKTWQKPDRFFQAGEYVVNLQIQDDYGKWSNKVEFKLKVTQQVVKSELSYRLEEGVQGDWLHNYNGVDYLTYKNVENISMREDKGFLIMSNSPETVKVKGLLYSDVAAGVGRLIFHHANGFTEEENQQEAKKLMIVARNTTDRNIKLTLGNSGIRGPESDILLAGQRSLQAFFKPRGKESYTVKPGESYVIYDSTEVGTWKKGQIITGLVDFETDGLLEFKSAVGSEAMKVSDIAKLPVAEKSVHNRGTFTTLNRYYDIDISSGVEPSKLVLGSKEEGWIAGIDALSKTEAINMGNYGMNVIVNVKAAKETGILFNPRGGVFRGAVKWQNEQIVNLPKEDYFTNKERAATVGTIPADSQVSFTYMLPNGSAAPVIFGFVPKDKWNE